LQFGIAEFAPLELRDDEVFERSQGDLDAEQVAMLTPAKLRFAEGAALTDDQIGLPARSRIDRIELASGSECLERRFQVHVQSRALKNRSESPQILRLGFYNDIDILGRSRRAVKRGSK